ncbi:MAG: hypothetical protein FJZ01_18330 [Candidatus Sericytochromatia bacterium]|nr:hypothetical protein [Candidatus Tanganyikabacteria bacterium]
MTTEGNTAFRGGMIAVCGHDSKDALAFSVGHESWVVSNGRVWRPWREAALPPGGVVLEDATPEPAAWLALKAAGLAASLVFLLVGVVASF